jgi:hypothetical protein
MKIRLLASLILFSIPLAACTPAQAQTRPPQAASATLVIESTSTSVVELTATGTDEGSLNSATPAPTVQAVATSRGPNLEATDPKTVSMASGGLQLVEFFEFW